MFGMGEVFSPILLIISILVQACSQDHVWGGLGPRKSGPFGLKKSGLFEPHTLNPPTKTLFWPNLWQKVDLLADLGLCVAPPSPWLRVCLRDTYLWRSICKCSKCRLICRGGYLHFFKTK